MAEEKAEEKEKVLELLPIMGENGCSSAAEELLRRRLAALEERLEQMKLSRRVLLRLLDRAEADRRVEVCNLRLENQRLRRQNKWLAHSIWEKNGEIVKLKLERR